jgi:hypothetical protein
VVATPLKSPMASCRQAGADAEIVTVRPFGGAFELARYYRAMSPVTLLKVSETDRVHVR